jgi:hypothetical protein
MPEAQFIAPPVVVATPSKPRRVAPRWLVIILACFFAGIIPETILTSSTSVLAIAAAPQNVIFIGIFYGAAMLLLREAIIRIPAGWPAVVLLGIAFGFCNEGVVAGTWYTVKNTGYVFFGPVDVAWVVALTIFHIFISMLLTVTFTDILFPSWAGKSLLKRGGMIVAGILFLLLDVFGALAPKYRMERLIVLVAAIVLVIIALRLPPATPRIPAATPLPRQGTLRVAGFFAYTIYFLGIYLIPAIIAQIPGLPIVAAQFVDMAIMLAFVVILLTRGLSWMRRAGWGLRQNLALITGIIFFSVVITVLVPGQLLLLQPVATAPFFILLIILARRLNRPPFAAAKSLPVPPMLADE